MHVDIHVTASIFGGQAREKVSGLIERSAAEVQAMNAGSAGCLLADQPELQRIELWVAAVGEQKDDFGLELQSCQESPAVLGLSKGSEVGHETNQLPLVVVSRGISAPSVK